MTTRVRRTLQSALLATAACALLHTPSALAQKTGQPWYTWQPIPFGGRTATMGGTGVAFGSDSAMPLLNPAGLSRVDRHNISMSATAYSLHGIDTTDFYTTGERDRAFDNPQVTTAADSMRSTTFDVYPTSFVYSWPLGAPAGESGHHVVSLSVLTPRRYTLEYVGSFGIEVAGARIENQITRSQTLAGYYVGPSYAVQATRWLRLGVAAMMLYHQAFLATSWVDRSYFGAETQRSFSSSTLDGSSYGLVPVVGVQIEPVTNFHMGLSAQIQSLHLAGSASYDESAEQSSSEGFVLDRLAEGTSVVSSTKRTSTDFSVYSPTKLAFGIGYESPRKWALGVDASYYLPIDYNFFQGTQRSSTYVEGRGTTVAEEEVAVAVYADGVINVNAGAEVFVADWLALRAGFFTDFSPTPALETNTDGSQLFNRKVNMYGGTAGLGFFFGPVDFTVGVVYAGGNGQIGALRNLLGNGNESSQNYQVADATESRLMGIVTGGVSFGGALAPVGKELEKVDAVIAPPPPPPPVYYPPPQPPAQQPAPPQYQPVQQPPQQPPSPGGYYPPPPPGQ